MVEGAGSCRSLLRKGGNSLDCFPAFHFSFDFCLQVSCSVSVSVSWMGKTYPPIWFICDCQLEDLRRTLVEDCWSLFLLLLLLRIGLDFPAVSCRVSLTGVLLWDSYTGLAIDVGPILSSIILPSLYSMVCLGGESSGFSPTLSLTGVFLWASLLVTPSLS